jgi:ribosomal protein RSM22 (predicted rRNA methylase)
MGRFPTAFPAALTAALAARLEGRGREALRARARSLSENYRARRSTPAAGLTETDALAYALTRMPATYAALIAVLGRLQAEQPDLAPASLLDAGCGPGAATFAAHVVWPDLAAATLMDRNRLFLDFAAALATESELPSPQCVVADLARLPDTVVSADLVVLAYALTEMADAEFLTAVEKLWARTGDTLVIVEPGAPRDYVRLMDARAWLIAAGARIVAPCPHDRPCPLAAPDWCHFPVRLPRSREHRLLKDADVPYEDEKFCFLVARRTGVPATGRLIAPSRAGKTGVAANICGGEGIIETFAARRDKALYQVLRKKDWGDALDALSEEKP